MGEITCYEKKEDLDDPDRVTVSFIRFIPPNAKRRVEGILMPREVAALAEEMRTARFSFEIELLHGNVHAEIVDRDDDESDDPQGALASLFIGNGPRVPSEIDRMIRAAHAEWIRRGRPTAVGEPVTTPFDGYQRF